MGRSATGVDAFACSACFRPFGTCSCKTTYVDSYKLQELVKEAADKRRAVEDWLRGEIEREKVILDSKGVPIPWTRSNSS